MPSVTEDTPPRPAPVFLTPLPRSSTAELLGRAAAWRGYELSGVPATVRGREVHWYGGPLAADRIAADLGVGLLEPADGWLTSLPRELTRRRIMLTNLAAAWRLTSPAFVKPPSDKSLPPAVYRDGSQLPRSGRRIGPDTPVLVSEVVQFTEEYRTFVLDGEVVCGSRYAVHGRLDPAPLHAEARAFAAEVLAAARWTLPSAVSIDIGRLDSGRWAVVEANMPWFAQIYMASADAVLDVVLRAAGPLGRVAARDLPFLRTARVQEPFPDGG